MRFTRENIAYDWFGLNDALFLFVNAFHAPGFDRFMLGVSSLGHPRMYPFHVALALWFAWSRPASLSTRNVAVLAIAYVLTSLVLVPMLKDSLDFPRPVAVFGEQAVTIVGDPDPVHSFPSGHAAFAVLMAASLMPGAAGAIQALLLAFAVLVCVSRISVGAHFPADVLAGALLALAVVATVRRFIGERARA